MDRVGLVLPRKRLPSPNLLFLSWLREMKTEAQEKQWKSYKFLKKAVGSMERYPLLLRSGKECAILEGLGQRTCLLIDQRLAALAAEKKCSAEEALTTENEKLFKAQENSKKKKRLSRKRQLPDEPQPSTSNNAIPVPLSQAQTSPTKRGRTSRSPGGYQPRTRSGPHALLLALYQFHRRSSLDSGITKEELMNLAQPLCDSSFKMPSVAGSFYTAWSSMGDLTKKDLVKMQRKHRGPALYFLTDAGVALAEQLRDREADTSTSGPSSQNQSLNNFSADPSPSKQVKVANAKVIHYVSDSEYESGNEGSGDEKQNNALVEPLDNTKPKIDVNSFLARCIEEDQQGGLDESNTSVLPLSERLRLSAAAQEERDLRRAIENSLLDSAPSLPSPSFPFPFSFVSSSKSKVPLRCQAFRKEDAVDGEPGFLVQCDMDDLMTSGCRYMLDIDSLGQLTEGQAMAFLHHKDAPAVSSEPQQDIAEPKQDIYVPKQDIAVPKQDIAEPQQDIAVPKQDITVPKQDIAVPQQDIAVPRKAAKPQPEVNQQKKFTFKGRTQRKEPAGIVPNEEILLERWRSDPAVETVPREEQGLPPKRPVLGADPTFGRVTSERRDRLPKRPFLGHEPALGRVTSEGRERLPQRTVWRSEPIAGTSTVNENVAPMNVLCELEAGEADIKLIVDTREHYGMGRVKQLLLPALLKRDTPCAVRPLPVGDFAWVVRRRGDGGAGVEAVLDCVIERKRVDDLASSLTDGRYREQKARMKKSGFSKIIYLIENFGGMKHTSIAPDTLMQTLANSQIVDGCMLTFCRDSEETVSYLSTLTNQLQQDYMTRKLKIVDSWQAGSSLDRSHLCLEWSAFMETAAKTPDPSVRLLFAKQLLRVSGTGPECVEAILGVCPTPRSLFLKCSSLTEDEWDKAFSDLQRGNLKKKIGAALSRAICMFYSAK